MKDNKQSNICSMGGRFHENTEYSKFLYVESQTNWSCPIVSVTIFSNRVSQTIFDSAIVVFGINLEGYILISFFPSIVPPFVCLSSVYNVIS